MTYTEYNAPLPNLAVVILAAGRGKRMNSDLPKVLHPLAGRPLIEYVVTTALKSGAGRIIAVVGYLRELVMERLQGRVEFVVQAEQLGTGHAVQVTEPLLGNFTGDTLILSGDVPLLRSMTVKRLLQLHRREGNACTLISCEFADPSDYGRVIRGASGEVAAIVEHKDASPQQLQLKEINSGIYLVQTPALFLALKTLKKDNKQGEYYLTDIVQHFVSRGLRVGRLKVKDPLEIAGVNSLAELETLEREYKKRNH